MNSTKSDVQRFFNLVFEEKMYSSSLKNLKFKLNSLCCDFNGKSVLDIGGGNGLLSLYASVKGARKVICLEPESDGSKIDVSKKFNKLVRKLNLKNIKLVPVTIQKFKPVNNKFDIVISYNSINHFDEKACIILNKNRRARDSYSEIFSKISKITSKHAELIISDCSNYNFWNLMGVTNPFAKNIEWFKHQSPYVWAKMLNKQGFIKTKIKWKTHPIFPFFGNRICSFFLISHFTLFMRKRSY